MVMVIRVFEFTSMHVPCTSILYSYITKARKKSYQILQKKVAYKLSKIVENSYQNFEKVAKKKVTKILKKFQK